MKIDERVKFDEVYVNEDYDTTTYYYTADKSLLKELFPNRYPEADSMAISLEFLSEYPDASRTSVMISPTKDGTDYDWIDVDISYDEIEALFGLAKDRQKNGILLNGSIKDINLKEIRDSIVETIKTAQDRMESNLALKLQVAAMICEGYGLIVEKDKNADKKDGFFISLRQDFAEQSIKTDSRELLCGFVPFDGTYECLADALDKMLSVLERGLKGFDTKVPEMSPFDGYSKECMKPLLDALNTGDFHLAQSLAPADYKLCGYQEFKDEYLHEQYAYGWAGQFEKTLIEPGRYPVFAKQYAFSERDNLYTNKLKDFQGLSIYLAGKCIADSYHRGSKEYPYENNVFESPYCHAVAHAIVEGKSSIHLIPPFLAEPVHFMYEGEAHTSYQIVDTSLPPYLQQDPMQLKNISRYITKTIGLSADAKKLYEKFLREYSYSDGVTGRNISLQELSRERAYSKEALIELLVSSKIKMNDGKDIILELSAKERLDLFHSDQMHYVDSKWLKLKQEYERCKKEYEGNLSLEERLASAACEIHKDREQLNSLKDAVKIKGKDHTNLEK